MLKIYVIYIQYYEFGLQISTDDGGYFLVRNCLADCYESTAWGYITCFNEVLSFSSYLTDTTKIIFCLFNKICLYSGICLSRGISAKFDMFCDCGCFCFIILLNLISWFIQLWFKVQTFVYLLLQVEYLKTSVFVLYVLSTVSQ